MKSRQVRHLLQKQSSWIGLGLVALAIPLYQSCGQFMAVDMGSGFPSVASDGVTAQACGLQYQPGHTMIHRLSNQEYNNTVKDLLFTQSDPAANFNSASIGSTGFSNESVALTISDQVIADYAKAAQDLADEVIASKGQPNGAYAKLASCAANSANPTTACASSVIAKLGMRAFRRPLEASTSTQDLAELMTVYNGGASFDEGFHDVIVALLIDPRFIFSYIQHPDPDNAKAIIALDDFELASRLSYFIWQTMPDEALFDLASAHQLTDPAVLDAQVTRMLKDPRSLTIATSLRREWAHLSLLEGSSGYAGLDPQTTSDIRQETQSFLENLIQEDRSALAIVNSKQTFVNSNLAAYYGWSIPTANSSNFVKVTIPEANRKGMVTQAATLLAFGGGSSYTHPVQRGRWVMDSLLCSAPGAPPPGVPSLDGNSTTGGTMRERLNAHVSSPACIGCHQVMDVYGLGLENFDMFGKWRTNYSDAANSPIDASGTVPKSYSFNDPQGMLAGLSTDPQVKTCLTKRLLSYALARDVRSESDRCVSKVLGANYIVDSGKFSDVIKHIATSLQFRLQAGGSL